MAPFETYLGQLEPRRTARLVLSCLLLVLLLPGASTRAQSAIVTIGPCSDAYAGICVTGAGAVVTLPAIQAQLPANQAGLLLKEAEGVWQLNETLFIDAGVTLDLSAPTVTQLKLRSATAGFASLVTIDGNISINGVKIYSWDYGTGTFDTNITDGRSFVLARGAARMNIQNAELSYLGAQQSRGYGVSWVDSGEENGAWRTRVTGQAINSDFHHNYYGVYLFQAANMTFRGNRFHHNINYGFDPHDYSHDVLVEDNEAFGNALHGFIISRGCYNFTFRRNRSYDNGTPSDPAARLGHGFMLDPGSPTATDPQSPSVDNLFEENRAWGNTGYGFRIVQSHRNTIRNNVFENHLQGITVEQESTNNRIEGNTVRGSQVHGIYLRAGANGNTVHGNTVTLSGVNGIYVRSSNNTVSGNTVAKNGSVVNGNPEGSGILLRVESAAPAAMADDFRLPSGVQATEDPDLGGVAQISVPTANVLTENTVSHNADNGIDLDGAVNTTVTANTVDSNKVQGIYLRAGASNNRLEKNTIHANRAYGIRASTATSTGNIWKENAVFENGTSGIAVADGANQGIQPPSITNVQGQTVTGMAAPGALVEIYSDEGKQGHYFEGAVQAGPDGQWSFTAPAPFRAPNINATATVGGNSSAFAEKGPGAGPRFSIHLPLGSR